MPCHVFETIEEIMVEPYFLGLQNLLFGISKLTFWDFKAYFWGASHPLQIGCETPVIHRLDAILANLWSIGAFKRFRNRKWLWITVILLDSKVKKAGCPALLLV